MDGYVIHIEVVHDQDHPASEDHLDDLMTRLADVHGVVSWNTRGWSATVTVDAEDAQAALAQAGTAVIERAAAAGLPTEPVTRVEVVREDIRDAELEQPTLPDLVSGAEAAAILGITRQRLHQLAHDHPDFPTPAYRLGVGMLWHRSAIERFASEWERRPGRPPAKSARELASA